MKKTRHLNVYYYIGIIALVLSLTMKQFFEIPDFINGFGMGLSITMLLFSIFVQTSSYQKLRTFKKNLFNK